MVFQYLSRFFSAVQGCSGLSRDVQGCAGQFRAFQGSSVFCHDSEAERQ